MYWEVSPWPDQGCEGTYYPKMRSDMDESVGNWKMMGRKRKRPAWHSCQRDGRNSERTRRGVMTKRSWGGKPFHLYVPNTWCQFPVP